MVCLDTPVVNTLKRQFLTLLQEGKTDCGINGELLDYLPKRGPRAFQMFIYSLMESEQDHIAKKLDQNWVDQWLVEFEETKDKEKAERDASFKTPPQHRRISAAFPVEESCGGLYTIEFEPMVGSYME